MVSRARRSIQLTCTKEQRPYSAFELPEAEALETPHLRCAPHSRTPSLLTSLQTWEVFRRFEDFAKLHAALDADYRDIPPFPNPPAPAKKTDPAYLPFLENVLPSFPCIISFGLLRLAVIPTSLLPSFTKSSGEICWKHSCRNSCAIRT